MDDPNHSGQMGNNDLPDNDHIRAAMVVVLQNANAFMEEIKLLQSRMGTGDSASSADACAKIKIAQANWRQEMEKYRSLGETIIK